MAVKRFGRELGVAMSMLRPYYSGALHKWFGFGVTALCIVEPCQVVEHSGDSGMVRLKPLLTNGEGALHKWLGFGVPALCLVEQCQVVEPDGDIGMVRLQSLLTDSEGA